MDHIPYYDIKTHGSELLVTPNRANSDVTSYTLLGSDVLLQWSNANRRSLSSKNTAEYSVSYIHVSIFGNIGHKILPSLVEILMTIFSSGIKLSS